MGYEQYWMSAPEIPQEVWDKIAADFVRVSALLHNWGLRLAGPGGTGHPVINGDVIAFNGLRKCGHPQLRQAVVWPTEDGNGISSSDTRKAIWSPPMLYVAGRLCCGSCACMPFVLHRTMPDDEKTKVYGDVSPLTVNGVRQDIPKAWVGKYYSRCRTLYRPYDLAVGCALLVAKRRLGTMFVVTTDGTNDNWADVRSVCQRVLGYGRDMLFASTTGRMRCARGTRTPKAPDTSGRHVPVYSPDGDGMNLKMVGFTLDGAAVLDPERVEEPADAKRDGGRENGSGRGRGNGRSAPASPTKRRRTQ